MPSIDHRPWFAGSFALALTAACTSGGGRPGGPDAPDAGGRPDADLADCDPDPGAGDVADGRDNDCDGLVDELAVCAGGGAPFATLGEAIAAAPAGGAIEVCAGTYAETLVIDGKPLRIRGEGAEVTVLDAGGAAGAIAIRGTGEGEVSLKGFTVRGGATAGEGGGIRCEGSALRLVDSVLTANAAGGGGGGLYADGCALQVSNTRFAANDGGDRGGGILLVDGSGLLSDSELSDNRAVHGGGLYLASDTAVTGNLVAGNSAGWTAGGIFVDAHAPTLSGNTVRDNTSAGDGGGIYVHMSQAVLADNTVSGNRAGDDGGGIRVFTSSLRLERNRVENNHAAGDGGGVKVSHLASELTDNVITGNAAEGVGGGLEMDNDASVVRGGEISGNQAPRGAGIHGWRFPWNGALIENVRIAGNDGGRGGGIYLEDNFQPVALRGLTVVDNTARHGAGLYIVRTRFTLANSLIAGNAASQEGGGLLIGGTEAWQGPWNDPCPCPPADAIGSIEFVVVHGNQGEPGSALWTDSPDLSVESSILSDNAGTAVTAVAAAPRWRYNDTRPATFSAMAEPTGSDGNLAVEPMFAGAAEGDFHLLAGSPCVDAGDPEAVDRDGSRADMGMFGGEAAP